MVTWPGTQSLQASQYQDNGSQNQKNRELGFPPCHNANVLHRDPNAEPISRSCHQPQLLRKRPRKHIPPREVTYVAKLSRVLPKYASFVNFHKKANYRRGYCWICSHCHSTCNEEVFSKALKCRPSFERTGMESHVYVMLETKAFECVFYCALP